MPEQTIEEVKQELEVKKGELAVANGALLFACNELAQGDMRFRPIPDFKKHVRNHLARLLQKSKNCLNGGKL